MNLSALCFQLTVCALALFPRSVQADGDPVKDLENYVNREVTSVPVKMGKVRVWVGLDDRDRPLKLVEFMQPYENLRPEVQARSRQLNWAAYESVRIRIRMFTNAVSDWRFMVCRPEARDEDC